MTKRESREAMLSKIREKAKLIGRSCELGYRMEWDKWSERIPYIKFNPDWTVKIIPPHNGAMVRFFVNRGEVGWVSVFLDCHNSLGFFVDHTGSPAPYWEVYPFENDGICRVAMDDVQGLVDAISRSLDYTANVGSQSVV